MVDKIKNVYSPYILDDVLQSVAVFCWGNDVSWKAFNVENDLEWQSAILEAKEKGLLSIGTSTPIPLPPPKPVVVPAPAYIGIPKTLTIAGGSAWNLRTEPDIQADIVGHVKVGEAIKLYSSTIQPNGGNNFYFVERLTPPANESAAGWLAYVLPATKPLPAPPTAYARLYTAHLKVAQAAFELATLYKELDEETNKLGNAA
jgi:hypothetical protein